MDWLPKYKKKWLRFDLIAGITVAAIFIPEAIAYSEIVGMPPQTALYGAWIAILLYAVFGTSKQLVIGASSTNAVMSASVISGLYPVGTAEFIAMTTALALMTGLVMVLAGVLRLGSMARFFSESVLVGFVTGLALVIMIKQVDKVFGIEASGSNFWETLYSTIVNLASAHWLTVLIGVASLAIMLGLEKISRRVPAALVAFAFGILITAIFKLDAYGVAIVGFIPSGLAFPAIPAINPDDLLFLFFGGIALGIMTYAEAMGPIHIYSAKYGYKVSDNRELGAIGASNVGAGLFQGFVVGASLSRTAANDYSGAKSQVSGIVTAILVIITAIFLVSLFYYLPQATLAAIIIGAVMRLVKVRSLRRLFRLRRADFWLAMIACVGVLTFHSLLTGLIIALIASLLALLFQVSQPNISILVRVPGRLLFSSAKHTPKGIPVPDLLIVRPDQAIFFANAAAIKQKVLDALDRERRSINTVVINLELSFDLDVPSADMLSELYHDLDARGVRLMIARPSTRIKKRMKDQGIEKEVGKDNIYPNIIHAVFGHLKAEGASVNELRKIVRDELARAKSLLQNIEKKTKGKDREKLARYEKELEGLIKNMQE